METASASEHERKDIEVNASTNPEGADANNERGDYGPWMLMERKKHAAKNWAACSHPLKSN